MPAYLTRVGVFSYMRADGTVVRELRPPQEVFSEDSLKTLRDAPVTDLHPDDMVSPGSWRKHSVGHVSGDPKKDGDFIAGELAIQDESAIQRIDAGERREVSCGYETKTIEEKGFWFGQEYDAVQTNIRYNHVGIGPKGWGRAGESVSLRLDSHSAVMVQNDFGVFTEKKKEKRNMPVEPAVFSFNRNTNQAIYDGLKYDVSKRADALSLIEKMKEGEGFSVRKDQQAHDEALAQLDRGAEMLAGLQQLLFAVANFIISDRDQPGEGEDTPEQGTLTPGNGGDPGALEGPGQGGGGNGGGGNGGSKPKGDSNDSLLDERLDRRDKIRTAAAKYAKNVSTEGKSNVALMKGVLSSLGVVAESEEESVLEAVFDAAIAVREKSPSINIIPKNDGEEKPKNVEDAYLASLRNAWRNE